MLDELFNFLVVVSKLLCIASNWLAPNVNKSDFILDISLGLKLRLS